MNNFVDDFFFLVQWPVPSLSFSVSHVGYFHLAFRFVFINLMNCVLYCQICRIISVLVVFKKSHLK